MFGSSNAFNSLVLNVLQFGMNGFLLDEPSLRPGWFFPLSVCSGFPLLKRLKIVQDTCIQCLGDTRSNCYLGEPFCRRPVLSCPHPPCRVALGRTILTCELCVPFINLTSFFKKHICVGTENQNIRIEINCGETDKFTYVPLPET